MRKSKRVSWIPLGMLLAGLFSSWAGCGGNSAPVQACYDFADVFGKAAQRCGKDYQINHNIIVAGLDCDNIVKVRDETALRQQCFPYIGQLSCQMLEDPQFMVTEPSCQMQFTHK